MEARLGYRCADICGCFASRAGVLKFPGSPEETKMIGGLVSGFVTLGVLIYFLVVYFRPDLLS